MQQKDRGIAALAGQRAATLTCLRALPPASWDDPIPPALVGAPEPGWRVREVVAYLVGIDEAATSGQLLRALRRSPDRRSFDSWSRAAVQARAEQLPATLVDALERGGARLQRIVVRLPSALGQVRVRGPFGRQPLLWLVYRRVLDEWVRLWDIDAATGGAAAAALRLPSGLAGGVPREVAPVLVDAVLGALPHTALPRASRTSGVVRLVIDPAPLGDAGPAAADVDRGGVAPPGRIIWSVDFGRRQYGPRVTARPHAVVRITAGALALVAEGRSTWDAADVDVSGDAGIAAALLDLVPPV